MDGLQSHGVRVPVVRIFFHGKHVVQSPFFELEGTIAHEVAGFGPRVAPIIKPAMLFDGFQMNGIPGVMIEKGKKIGSGCREGDFQLFLGQCLGSYLREVLQGSLMVGFGIFHQKEHIGVFTGQFRRQNALEGMNEILRCHRIPIGPSRLLPKGEGVDRAILTDRPAFCHAGNRMQVVRILSDQSFGQSGDHIVFWNPRNNVRVNAFRLRSIGQVEDLGSISLLDHCVRWDTGSKPEGQASCDYASQRGHPSFSAAFHHAFVSDLQIDASELVKAIQMSTRGSGIHKTYHHIWIC